MPNMQIIVVGVDGDRATQEVAKKHYVETVFQAKPEGVAAARNQGLATARTQIVAFIDDDARARSGWASALATSLSDSEVSAVGGPVFDTRTNEQVVYPWVVDAFGVTRRSYLTKIHDGAVPTLNGCNMAFRREVLLAVGGFDPYFRYYYDETDLCVRLARAGYSIRFEQTALVDHDFADGPTRHRFLYNCARTRAYFSLKNYAETVPLPKLIAVQMSLIRSDIHDYRYYLRGSYVGYRGAAKALGEALSGRARGIFDGMRAIAEGQGRRLRSV